MHCHSAIAMLVGQAVGLVIGLVYTACIATIAGRARLPFWPAVLLTVPLTVGLMVAGMLIGWYGFGG